MYRKHGKIDKTLLTNHDQNRQILFNKSTNFEIIKQQNILDKKDFTESALGKLPP